MTPATPPLTARDAIAAKLRHERGLPDLMTSVGFQSGLEFALREIDRDRAARDAPSVDAKRLAWAVEVVNPYPGPYELSVPGDAPRQVDLFDWATAVADQYNRRVREQVEAGLLPARDALPVERLAEAMAKVRREKVSPAMREKGGWAALTEHDAGVILAALAALAASPPPDMTETSATAYGSVNLPSVERLAALAKLGATFQHLEGFGIFSHHAGTLWECKEPRCIEDRELAWTPEEREQKMAALAASPSRAPLSPVFHGAELREGGAERIDGRQSASEANRQRLEE